VLSAVFTDKCLRATRGWTGQNSCHQQALLLCVVLSWHIIVSNSSAHCGAPTFPEGAHCASRHSLQTTFTALNSCQQASLLLAFCMHVLYVNPDRTADGVLRFTFCVVYFEEEHINAIYTDECLPALHAACGRPRGRGDLYCLYCLCCP
jgi:hypothetical protein